MCVCVCARAYVCVWVGVLLNDPFNITEICKKVKGVSLANSVIGFVFSGMSGDC